MNRRTALSMLPAAAAAQSTIRQRFIGVWKLVRYESTDKKTGEVRQPYGPNPVGRITYDAAGRMSAQLMRPDRRPVGGSPANGAAAAIRSASCDDLREMLSGFASYFGTFDVDEANRTVIHHVQASLIPSWVGTDLRRSFEFSGNQLILTVTGDQTVLRLRWQREA